jgi:hypothetical protein
LNVIAVHRSFAAARRANEFFQFQKSVSGAIHIDTALFGFTLTQLAEAGHVAGIDRRCVMRGSEAIAKRTLPLGSIPIFPRDPPSRHLAESNAEGCYRCSVRCFHRFEQIVPLAQSEIS